VDLTRGPNRRIYAPPPRGCHISYNRQLTDEYNPLTDKYIVFIFLLLHVLSVSSDVEPPKQTEYTAYHTQQQDNIVHDKRKQNKFDNSR
jgi:hypothetical protein